MKNLKSVFAAILLGTFTAAFCAVFCASCYQPSPLYGAWSDNAGNKITFSDDGSFSASIKDSNGDVQNYSGDFTVVENIISFSKEDGSLNSEWDLRGGILYLTWFDAYGSPIKLTLYHAG